ncbi:MAG: DUF2652 domain-containing protein [Ignavibacteriales bacterium]
MNTRKGYFVIADITGFTSFIADSELEHSQLILSDILKRIVSKFTPTLTLAEIEGDAVFVYTPVEKFPRGEIILEIIESLYYEFRDTKATLKRLVTCNCKACEMVHTLDLKFIIHSGDYVLNEVAGKVKPLGNSINTVHRLLKNKVNESTGWRAYILFTEEALNSIGLNLNAFHTQKEYYEHIGEITTYSINLESRYEEFTESRIIKITEKDADYFVESKFNVSISELWDWVNTPEKRSMWLEVSDWKLVERPSGRTGKGATNHCANSNFLEKLLDYRPFEYYTSEMTGKNMTFMLTGKFDKLLDGTKFTWFMKLKSNLPKPIRKYFSKFIWKKGLKIDGAFKKLDQLIKLEKNKVENNENKT